MYEPSKSEIILTELIGRSLAQPYYRSFVDSLALSNHEHVLDFCSGSGIISDLILKKLSGGRLTCADVSHKWLKVLNQRLKGSNWRSVYLDSLDVESIQDAPFDKAVIHFVLHDFNRAQREKVLKLVKRSLKPGGLLIIREPSAEGHGLALFELINLLEKLKLGAYTYKQQRYPLIGETIDLRIRIKEDGL
ncbi:MAG: class I SAM-dependent methyltransferase [Clostridia bacterium]|nr:class I SAM-dependent methyltransferase [Clostridia bacterium]